MSISSTLRTIAAITCFAFVSSLPGRAVADASPRSDLASSIYIYEQSVKSYRAHRDANQFLWAFGDTVDSSVRSGLAVALSHFSGMLPVVVAQGEAAFEIKVSSTQKIHIDIEDVEAGVFRIDGKRFVWDEDENFEANAKRIATLIDGDGLTAQILLALIPTAFAGSMTEEEPETSPVPTKSGIRTAKEPDSKTIQTSEEIKDKAKKDCSDQERQGKGACSVGFWIGIAVAVAAAALLIYFICKRHKGSSSKKSKKRLSSSSKSTSKPEKPKENHPWIDAPNFGSAESNLKTASSAGVVNENSKPSSHTPSTWTTVEGVGQ